MRKPQKPGYVAGIKKVTYDNDTGTLEMEFYRGGTFQYLNVPVDVVMGFTLAESQWAFYLAKIRKVYRSRQKK